MSSEKQIAANRANAQKSTGPTTVAGLEKVSRNATRHGLLARTIVLDRENQDRFTFLLATLHEDFEPTNTVECDLVENMAIARWRLMRLWSIEKANFDQEMQKQESADLDKQESVRPAEASLDSRTPDDYELSHQASLHAARAFHSLGKGNNSLDLMARYEARFERLYARSFDRLIKLRGKCVFAKQTQFHPDAA